MDTLGLWLGPTLAVVVAALGNRWLGWFQPRSKRRTALRRIAVRLSYEDSQGYDYQYERYLEHYLGGRDWHHELDKMNTQDKNGNWYDSRGPAPKWWQRLATRP
jgi:hypothetical protein